MKLLNPLLVTAALAFGAPLANADILLLDAIAESPSNSAAGLSRPRTGQDMNQTRSQFGEPMKEISWIGDPPISRWVYDQFTVYFENNRVITTVVHR